MNLSDHTVFKDSGSINTTDWFDYLKKNACACYFHTPFYYNALVTTRDISPVFYCVHRNDKIVALAIGECGNELELLPVITRRTIFYAEPLFEDEEALNILLKSINSSKGGLFIQFRPFFPITQKTRLVFESYGYRLEDHLNAYISITTEAEIYNNFEKDRKKGIQAASRKHGIEIIEPDNINDSVDRFYELQKRLYKGKRHALKNKDYFLNMYQSSMGHIKIIFAIYKGEMIASQLYAIFGERLIALYTATLQEHKNKKAGDLLVWHMIKTAVTSDIKLFDFGGGGNPYKSYAPREYKRRFGTRFENVGRLTLPKSPLYKISMFLYSCLLKH